MDIQSIHFYVKDTDRIANLFIKKMGMQDSGWIDNGITNKYILGENLPYFSVSSLPALACFDDELSLHPSGVRNIAFWVENLDEIRRRIDRLDVKIIADESIETLPALKIKGWGSIDHTIIQSPRSSRSKIKGWGSIDRTIIQSPRSSRSKIKGWGSIDRTIIQSPKFSRSKIKGWGSIDRTIIQSPKFSQLPARRAKATNAGTDLQNPITGIDHIVLNVPAGELDAAVAWYREIFDFQVEQTFTINTDRSGLFSKALISACGNIRFNINEPSSPNSQVQEFLDLNRGAGIQHIALHTDNIFETVDRLQQQGVEFLPIPTTYYDRLKIRDRSWIESLLTSNELQAIERLQILVDWSKDAPKSLLMQTFTKPIFEQPTFFFEIIERRVDSSTGGNRAQGFGAGNFQALFEAVERHQEQL
jgi:4-hydroxyphenylpyruvate dioxygenase